MLQVCRAEVCVFPRHHVKTDRSTHRLRRKAVLLEHKSASMGDCCQVRRSSTWLEKIGVLLPLSHEQGTQWQRGGCPRASSTRFADSIAEKPTVSNTLISNIFSTRPSRSRACNRRGDTYCYGGASGYAHVEAWRLLLHSPSAYSSRSCIPWNSLVSLAWWTFVRLVSWCVVRFTFRSRKRVWVTPRSCPRDVHRVF